MKKLLFLNIPNVVKCMHIAVSINKFLTLPTVFSPQNTGQLCLMMLPHQSCKLSQLAHFNRHNLILLPNTVCDPDMIIKPLYLWCK
jgi:hypothetical protein